MGKRLYPIAKAGVTEVEVFNAVAPEFGYATITPERLAVYNDLTEKRKDGAISDDAYYRALYSDGNEDICQYNAFVVFGFGKISTLGMRSMLRFVGRSVNEADRKHRDRPVAVFREKPPAGVEHAALSARHPFPSATHPSGKRPVAAPARHVISCWQCFMLDDRARH